MTEIAGFDESAFPAHGISTIQWLVENTNLREVAYYLAPASDRIGASWMGNRQALADLGLSIAPIYVGQQDQPGFDPSRATGVTDADQATSEMWSEGFALGSTVYLDVENGAPLSQAEIDYITSWTAEVAKHGYTAGVYCPGSDGPVVTALPNVSLWAADYDPNYYSQYFAAPGTTQFTRWPISDSGTAGATAWQYEIGPEGTTGPPFQIATVNGDYGVDLDLFVNQPPVLQQLSAVTGSAGQSLNFDSLISVISINDQARPAIQAYSPNGTIENYKLEVISGTGYLTFAGQSVTGVQDATASALGNGLWAFNAGGNSETDVIAIWAQDNVGDWSNEFDLSIAVSGGNLPSLRVSSASLFSPNLVPGGGGSVLYTVANDGTTSARSTSTSQIYLSTSSTLSSSAILVSAASTDAALAVGANQPDQLWFGLPSSLAPGNYYLIVACDVGNTVPEAVGSNTYAIPITVNAASDTSPPQLITDQTLNVGVGGTSPITESLLRFDDNVSAHAQLTYTILNAPQHGTVLKNGNPVSSFKQADIDSSAITYRENGSSASSDLFTFSVTDAAGNTTANQSFQIQINGNTGTATPLSGTLTGTNVETATTSISAPVYLDHSVSNGNTVNAVLENSGAMSILSGGSIVSDGTSGDTFYNLPGGTLTIAAPTLIDFMPTFYNEGLLVVSPGAGQTAEITSYLNYPSVAFNNTGTVQVQTGTFDIFQGGTSNASSFNIAADATLLFTGGSSEPFTFTGGTYDVAGTTQIGNGAYVGDLIFGASTIVNASLDWTLDDGTLDLSAATLTGSFTNLTLEDESNYLYLGSNNSTIVNLNSSNATVVVNGTGTIKLTGTGVEQSATTNFWGGGTVENIGTLALTDGSDIVLQNDEAFDNAGLLSISGAIYDNDNNSSDTLENLNGATIELQDSGLVVANIDNSGTINVEGGTYNPVGGYLTNTGAFNVTSGIAYLTAGGTSNFSDWSVSAGATLNFSTGTFTFNGGVYNTAGTTNNGALWRVAGPATIVTPIGNYGTIEIQSGSLTLDGSVSGSGSVLLDANVTLALASPTGFASTINGFAVGDTIDLVGVVFDANGNVTLGANNLLSITENGRTYGLQLSQSQSFAGESFVLLSDDNGGSEVQLSQVQTITSGQTISGTTVTAGNALSVFGSALGTTLGNGGSQVVQSGGMASGTVIDNGGHQSISSGGQDTNAVINDGGYQQVLSGGVASDTTINDPGMQVVASGATATDATIDGGGQDVYGSAISTTIGSGGLEIVEIGGVASGTTILSGGVQYDLGSAVDTTVEGGTQYIEGNASAGFITAGGTQVIFDGGESTGFTIEAASSEIVDAGGTDDGATIAGGIQYVYGFASGVTILPGGSQLIESGGTVEITAGSSIGGTLAFAGDAGTLRIDAATAQSMPSKVIGDFAVGDVIDLANVSFASSGQAVLQANNVLAIIQSGQTYDLDLDPGQSFSDDIFQITSDGSTGTDVTLTTDTTPPAEVHDSSAAVTVGGTATITQAELQFDDDISTHTQETYSIINAPAYGTLLKNGAQTSSFTQADIDNGLISYRENGGIVSSDSVVFEVTDAAGNQTSAEQFQIQISTPPQPPPVPPTAPGTTAAMIMRKGANGNYEIYDLGNNGILAATALGQVGLEWQIAGFGGFNGAGTSDMILRDSNNGALEVYDIGNNQITYATGMGQVGLEWKVAGFGDFSSRAGETDMLMRNSNTGQFEIYDIGNNAITFASPMGQVGLEWSVAGFGDFSTRPDETDMLMRNGNTGQFEIYDISDNAITSAGPMGQVGLEWSVAGFGDFSGNANETDMLMRNNNTGAFEIYDIGNSQLTSAAPMGQVGLEWQVAGFGSIDGAGSADMLMRNSNTGQFEIYDIANNTLASAAPMGQVGLEWSVAGIAADPPAASGTSNAQLVQAMASLTASNGALDGSSVSQSTTQLPAPSLLAPSNGQTLPVA